MSTINQAAVGNLINSYGTVPGSLQSYLFNSAGSFLDSGLAGNGWNFLQAFGDPRGEKIFNSKLNGGQSITGYDAGLGAVAGFAGGLLDKSAAHLRTSGKYGYVGQAADTVADAVGMVGNYNPLATGLGRLGMGAINKITGGTDGMTVQDSLLGSGAVSGTLAGIAAASATNPIGWAALGTYALASGINAATGKTTTDNVYKSFMDKDKLTDVASGYTDMDLENEARNLYNKKYGGFSRSAYKKAQKKIDQAQMQMTDKIDIRDTANLGQIRAGMVDANNLRYQMAINGGYKPLTIGREGLKITPERMAEAKRIAKCIKKKKSSMFNVIPAEAREAMRDVTKVPNDALPFFKSGGNIELFQNGGDVNVIPEGALHARKHHMENDEHITKKGIPVVDVNGTQQAEIERNEIIFRKEVTDKLEELAKDGSDEAAIEAGKLLAVEIIENTEDRTGLIGEVTGEPKLNHEVIPSAKLGATLGGIFKEGTTKEDIYGIGQKAISVLKFGKEAKKKEQEIQDETNRKNLEDSLKISRAWEEKNSDIMDESHRAKVTTTNNGFISNTEPLKDIPRPEISNTSDNDLKELFAEFFKLNTLENQNGAPAPSNDNLMAMIPIIEGLTKTKKAKDDSSKDGDAPAEVPSVATPTLVGKDYASKAQEGTKLPEFSTYESLLEYLKQTGRDSDRDYDLKRAYEDPEVYQIWREEEEKNPGQGHWLDRYKKDSHITYSSESVLGENPKKNGGRWVNANGKDIFIVSPYLEKKYSLDDYLDYFSKEEPTIGIRYKGITYFPGRRKK